MRRVSAALCDAVEVEAVDDDIRVEMNKSASLCLAAKERLLEADTDAQIETAVGRVKILCDD